MEILKYWWKVIFVLVLIGLGIAYKEEVLQIFNTMEKTPIWLFFAAMMLVFAEFLLQAARLKIFLRRSWWETLRAYAVGRFVAFSFPSRTLGEGARFVVLAKELGVGLGEAAAFVSVERLVDMAVITVAASLILVNVNLLLAAFVAAAILIVFVFLESDSIHAKIVKKLPNFVVNYIEQARRAVKERRILLAFFLITIVLWFIDFFRMWLILRVMGTEVDYLTVSALVSIAYILAAVSFLPGGLGAFEGGLAGGLVIQGVPYDLAIAATLYERFFSYWLWIIIGALAGTRPSNVGNS